MTENGDKAGAHQADVETQWYLLRTKTGEERKARDQLGPNVEGILLPLAKVHQRQSGRLIERIVPLFSCYLFASFDLARSYRRVRYASGVRDLVWFGGRPAVVPTWVMGSLLRRCENGPVEFPVHRFSPGTTIRITDGPFQNFEAIFEQYLPGTERVAVLLSLMNTQARVRLPAATVVAAE